MLNNFMKKFLNKINSPITDQADALLSDAEKSVHKVNDMEKENVELLNRTINNGSFYFCLI